MRIPTVKESRLLAILRAKKKEARQHADQNDSQSEYWRGQYDAIIEVVRLLETLPDGRES